MTQTSKKDLTLHFGEQRVQRGSESKLLSKFEFRLLLPKMSAINDVKSMKAPKAVFMAAPADFAKFEDNLKMFAEKYLSPNWEWTFKVNGKVQQEIQRKEPENEGLRFILKNEGGESKHEIHSYSTPVTVRSSALRADSGPRIPPPPPGISSVVADALGKRHWQVAKLKESDDRFFKADTNTFEERGLLGVRKEIWEWMILCIEGEHKTLFCAHLVRECDKWDVQQLYKAVKDFLQTENYREYGERMERFFTARPKEGEDIFSFMSRMDKYEEEIGHLQFLAEEAGETLKMPKFCRVWKILSAVEKYPEYRVFTDKVQQMAPKDWIAISVDQIRQELHKIHSNKVSLYSEKKEKQTSFYSARSPPPLPAQSRPNGGAGDQRPRNASKGRSHTPAQRGAHPRDSRSPSRHGVADKLKHYSCPEGECLGYFRSGKCPRKELGKPCIFKHTPAAGNEANARSRSVSPVYPQGVHTQGVPQAWKEQCSKCGEGHALATCTWSKQCFECGGMHAVKVCRKKGRTTQFGAPSRERRNSV